MKNKFRLYFYVISLVVVIVLSVITSFLKRDEYVLLKKNIDEKKIEQEITNWNKKENSKIAKEIIFMNIQDDVHNKWYQIIKQKEFFEKDDWIIEENNFFYIEGTNNPLSFKNIVYKKGSSIPYFEIGKTLKNDIINLLYTPTFEEKIKIVYENDKKESLSFLFDINNVLEYVVYNE